VRKLYQPFRIFSYVVLLLMLGAMGYALSMIIILWVGIRV